MATVRPVSIYLVRHATAGQRGGFGGEDLARPLDEGGQAQAEAIAQALVEPLRDLPELHILSSRAKRCVDTLVPLATQLGRHVEIADELTEGSAPGSISALFLRIGSTPAVLCSHGDIIPECIRDLMADGMRITGARHCEKGSIWQLDLRGTDIVTGTYLGIPTLTPT